MIRNLSLALVLILTAGVSQANDRSDRIQTLVEALGLLDAWSQQIEVGRQQTEEMGQQMLDQLLLQLNPNEEFHERFSAAFEAFSSKLDSPWSAQELVDVWASFYGPEFTDHELDQLINFYTSPLGQKDVRVTHAATEQFSKHFYEANKSILESATTEFLEEVKIIARECKCRR